MNTTNSTQLAAAKSGTEPALGASLLGIDILIIVFNVLTIMVIVRFQTKNAVDVFVLTLALHDLVKGLVPVPITIYVYFSHWELGRGTVVCNLYGWVAFMTNAGSMLILTLMAIERFFAIIKPFSYRAWVSTGKVQMVAFIAVVFTGFHSALPLMGVGRIIPYYGGAYSHFDYSRKTNGTRHYAMFVLSYGFGMIFIVIVAYSFVFYKIRSLIHRHRRMNRVSESYNTTSGRELNLKTETMFSYLALVLMLLFMGSWLPFLIVVVASQMDVKIPLENLDQITMRIVVVNSMLNPLAYVILCKPYRLGILYYFRKLFSLCGFQRPSNDIWDPWRRVSLARRRHDKFTNYSCTDSGIAGFNEYSKHRMPSTFQSYDTYRAKKEDKHMESSLSEMEKEPCINEDGLIILSSDKSVMKTHFVDSATKLMLQDKFDITEEEVFDDLETRRRHADKHRESSDMSSEADITTSLDTIAKSSPNLLSEELSERKEMLTEKKKFASLDFQAEDMDARNHSTWSSKNTGEHELVYHKPNGVCKYDKDGAAVIDDVSTNKVGDHALDKQPQQQQQQQQQQEQQHKQSSLHMQQELASASPINENNVKKEIKTKSKSKSTTNLQYEWKRNGSGGKISEKSTSSLDFYLQDSMQPTHSLNGIYSSTAPHNDILNDGITTVPRDFEYTSDNVRINDRGASTPLKDLAKMIRDFDSNENEINISYRNSKCLFKCCEPQEDCDCCGCEETRRTCEHCCYRQWNRNDLRNSVNMRNERTQSLQQLNTCTCMRQRDEDIGRSMECVINFPCVSRTLTSDRMIPVDYMRSGNEADIELCTAGSRKSRDFLEIDKLLEKTVLSLYENQQYDT